MLQKTNLHIWKKNFVMIFSYIFQSFAYIFVLFQTASLQLDVIVSLLNNKGLEGFIAFKPISNIPDIMNRDNRERTDRGMYRWQTNHNYRKASLLYISDIYSIIFVNVSLWIYGELPCLSFITILTTIRDQSAHFALFQKLIP